MLVFVHINKTAGSTVRYILRSSYGSRHCDVEPWGGPWDEAPFSSEDLRRLRRIYPRLASIAGHRVTGYADLADDSAELRYVTFLRDPLRMCASRFQYHVQHRKKTHLVFDEWIQRDWLRDAQTKRIAGTASADAAIRIIESKEMFVGLTEHFDESLVLLKALRAGDLDIDYKPVNVARSNTLAQELLSSSSAREALVDANRADLELYSYVRDQLYPSLQREYGTSLTEAVDEYRRASRGRWNTMNLAGCRLRQYLVYKPALRLYRGRATRGVAERLLGAGGASGGAKGSTGG